MEDIKKVRILKTVKFGGKVYLRGEIISEPIPTALLSEIKKGKKTVEVFEEEPRSQCLKWRWPCAYCEEGFSRKTDLAGHIKETHHAPFKVFGQEFALPSNK